MTKTSTLRYVIVIISSILVVLFASCTGIREQTRRGKDLVISKDNSELLKGCNIQSSHKALFLHRLLTNTKETYDTPSMNYNLCLTPIDKKHLLVDLRHDSSSVLKMTVKGRYRNGYFQIRRWRPKMIVGPLVWSLTDQLTCVGISKENKLVLVYTTGGQLLLVLFPFMAAKGPDVVYDFDWTK